MNSRRSPWQGEHRHCDFNGLADLEGAKGPERTRKDLKSTAGLPHSYLMLAAARQAGSERETIMRWTCIHQGGTLPLVIRGGKHAHRNVESHKSRSNLGSSRGPKGSRHSSRNRIDLGPKRRRRLYRPPQASCFGRPPSDSGSFDRATDGPGDSEGSAGIPGFPNETPRREEGLKWLPSTRTSWFDW